MGLCKKVKCVRARYALYYINQSESHTTIFSVKQTPKTAQLLILTLTHLTKAATVCFVHILCPVSLGGSLKIHLILVTVLSLSHLAIKYFAKCTL